MANTNAPNGFTFAYNIDGRTQNASQAVRQILYSDTTAIYFGDPVTSQTSGYIAQSAAGTTQIAGIFVGCKYFSASVGKTIWSMYWPGVAIASTLTVEAYIINDPSAVFEVQAGGTAIGIADIAATVQFNLGTGNTSTGLSGAYVESANTTNTLPFKVVALKTAPPGANGTDSTSAYNRLYVTFNNQDFKVPLGI